MSECKRYASSSDDWPAPNGDWIRHTDHLAATAELRRELEEREKEASMYHKSRNKWSILQEETANKLVDCEHELRELETERDTLKREVEELRSRIMWFDVTEALPRPFQLVFAEREDGSAGKAIWNGGHWLMEKDQRGHESEIKAIRWRNILDSEVAALNQREK